MIADTPPHLPIVYRDDSLAVIDKPSGLLVHRTALARKEKWFAMQLLRDQLGCHVYPVHRLDRPTSGLLVFALSADVARQMSELIQAKQMHKQYLALCRGWLFGHGTIDYPLKEELDKTTDSKAQLDKAAQAAVTHYQAIAHLELPYAAGRYQSSRFTWLQLEPETGRKHQLRRHLAHLRHPIIGDTTHGDGRQNRAFAEHSGCHRLMLHAKSLTFEHPISGKLLELIAPLPPEWQRLQASLNWPSQINHAIY
ncbi:tRNA pseudouridine(65) synthase TruC [Neiella marina]|uniref:tRNA pseudouridine synthase C n=1 Tax=Neiella holothuriorum TaxID=2870530 RepID=A0ABS7EHD5_9GAMM|nr:tRNA pseudouridine(65) synthase TruC [Neiella holothuriorum]MBW8191748.1 tRNA pseudouridine(65) synthase TruC [Neiella holothuriorum]